MNSHVIVLEIDLKAITQNINYFKSKLQQSTKLLAVVKAFGYGSDAIAIAKLLEKEQLAYYLAVAYTHEGVALRNAGIKTPILVLHPQVQNLNLLIEYHLEPNVYSFKLLKAFTSILKDQNKKDYPIHIKINTGLNRLGFQPSEIERLIVNLVDKEAFKVHSIFSHLAASEDLNEKAFTLQQIKIFKEVSSKMLSKLENVPLLHMLNTSGIINYASEAQFDMVRLGIGMFGLANSSKETNKLQNVLTLKSVISQIQELEKGSSIGYNRALITSKAIKIATIPIGHADGISRNLGNNKGCVYINNQQAPIIGNVCMDMILVDITTIHCKEGDVVILFDTQDRLELMAKKADTISYEILTALSQRIRRKIK